jgi:hypothetical protein
MRNNRLTIFIAFVLCVQWTLSQEESDNVTETFSSIRIVNGQSTETLKQREFRYIIAHRFGDAAGEQGGVQTAFGFDEAADIRFGFDFGFTDELLVGVARLKGNGAPYRSIIESFAKYRFLTQNNSGMPISAAVTGNLYTTYMPASDDITSVTNFQDFSHRMAYSTQLTIARKFHPRFSVALMPTYVHRNYVRFDDVNGLFSLGGAANIKVFKRLGLVAEYFYNFEPDGLRENYRNNLSVAMEWLTNGHVFSFHFTNARGMGDLQYIALNSSDWLEGQFRFGFTITRTFKL